MRSHWFEAMLFGGADFAKVYAASAASSADGREADPPFQIATWRKANPSLSENAALAPNAQTRSGKKRNAQSFNVLASVQISEAESWDVS